MTPKRLSVIFMPAARAEVIEAQDWYEAHQPGLGRRFRAQVDAAVQTMIDQPRQYALAYLDIRRARLRHFPYGLFYRIESDALVVIACFHSSRDPKQWRSRA